MLLNFVNRENELSFLEKEFKKDSRSLVVVYGRRRVGKTELIKKFISGKPHVYFLVSEEPTHVQLERLIKNISRYFNERHPKINDWAEGIEYIGEKLKNNKIILVIDEFPYLIDSNKSIPSYFQKLNDEFLIDSKSMLILSGSSIGMMESKVLGHKSPLYGRRTGQIDLASFNFEKAGLMIKNKIEEKVAAYSIFGNTPMYLSFFDNTKSMEENILLNILDKRSFLYKEPEFILKQELREPSKYMSILTYIAQGNRKVSKISNKTNMPAGTLSKYLEQLQKLRLIYRQVPVTERNKKSKKSLYFIEDGLFNFWFEFIEPNLSDVEDNPKKFYQSVIKPGLPSYVSATFEKVCKEFVRKSLNYGKIERWWHKDMEIDIVGLNEQTNEILFAECKWSSSVDAKKILAKLMEKKNSVRWRDSIRKEHYAIFAKSFKKKIKDVMLFDLKDIEKIFKKKK